MSPYCFANSVNATAGAPYLPSSIKLPRIGKMTRGPGACRYSTSAPHAVCLSVAVVSVSNLAILILRFASYSTFKYWYDDSAIALIIKIIVNSVILYWQAECVCTCVWVCARSPSNGICSKLFSVKSTLFLVYFLILSASCSHINSPFFTASHKLRQTSLFHDSTITWRKDQPQKMPLRQIKIKAVQCVCLCWAPITRSQRMQNKTDHYT